MISEVPLLDMLRYTLLPAGASWIAEYGDPAIPEEAAYLAKYSPYQNVRPDVAYPPALFLTSTADDRVHPGHARKMAAQMQSQGHRALFYEETEGGHGGGGDLRRQAAFTRANISSCSGAGRRRAEAAGDAPQSRDAGAWRRRSACAPACRELDAMEKAGAMAIAVTPSQRARARSRFRTHAPTAARLHSARR